MDFEDRKKRVLLRADKSMKGSIDFHIKKLIDLINSSDNYYTTSSCSGRIHVMFRHSMKKHDIISLFHSHEKADTAEILSSIKSFKSDVPGMIFFRFEPMIIHVGCRSLDYAEMFYALSRKAGFLRPGIISLSSSLVEVSGNDIIHCPVGDESRSYVDDRYIGILTDTANSWLKENHARLDAFYKILKENIL